MPELINTLETPGEFDALSKLRPGEPYFPLIGRDRLAPPRVMDWAWANRERALKEFSEGKIDKETYERELDKSTEAEAIAWSMQAYKAGHEAKKAMERNVESYVGAELPEETKRRDRLQAAKNRTRTTIHNTIAELVELGKIIDPGKVKGAVSHEIDALKHLADLLTPPRPGMQR